MPPKRKPKRRRAPPRRSPKPAKARKRTPTPKPKPKRKPAPKRKRKAPSRKRSLAAKKGWQTRRIREAIEREREAREWREGEASGPGDVEVIDEGGPGVDPDYEPYPLPEIGAAPDEVQWALVSRDEYVEAMQWLEDRFGLSDDHAAAMEEEIEWFPTFDEVYDYIDALVEEYDLDAHELFELAFGYADEAVA